MAFSPCVFSEPLHGNFIAFYTRDTSLKDQEFSAWIHNESPAIVAGLRGTDSGRGKPRSNSEQVQAAPLAGHKKIPSPVYIHQCRWMGN